MACHWKLTPPKAGTRDALALTRPYYGVGFELVAPHGVPADLAALKGRKVSVQNASVANLAAVRLGLDWTAQTTAKAQLETLDGGRAQAALVWARAASTLSGARLVRRRVSAARRRRKVLKRLCYPPRQ